MIDNAGKSPQPTGDASLLFAARERVSSSDGAIPSAWMLRQGAGDLLLYLAARSVRVGVIAGPSTTPAEFESFVQQLRQQSVVVGAAISPAAMNVEGMEASLAKAGDELSGGGGAGSEVLVVGSSDPILRAATAAKMFTARYHPPNSRRQGVIQTFVVRDIDEVGAGFRWRFCMFVRFNPNKIIRYPSVSVFRLLRVGDFGRRFISEKWRNLVCPHSCTV